MPIYTIADVTVEMEPIHERVIKNAEPYLSDAATAQINIKTSADDIRSIAEHNGLDDLEICEYLLLGQRFCRYLLEYDGMQLHSSAVVVDGRAYLFSADSGTGKSTHTSLWKQIFGERAQIINDDKPAIRLIDGVFYAYGTPFCGKDDININARAPIAGICFIERGEVNEIHRIGVEETLPLIMKQIYLPRKSENMDKLLSLIEKICLLVPTYKLKGNMSVDAAKTSYCAMSGEQI